MNRSFRVVLLLVLISCFITPACSRAETILAVDFGRTEVLNEIPSTGGKRVLAGFEDFSSPSLLPPSTSHRVFNGIDVILWDRSQASNGLFFEDAGTMNHELGALAEDYVVSSGPELTLIIKNLPAADYVLRSFHHSPRATVPVFLERISILSPGPTRIVGSNLPVSIGLTPTTISAFDTPFTIIGFQDFEIVFKGVPIPARNLNGFILTRIPEPTSLTIIASGVGLWLLTRFSQRRTLNSLGLSKSSGE